jgi:chemotaxis family two-component system response regulator PixH
MARVVRQDSVSSGFVSSRLWDRAAGFESHERPTLLWIDDFEPALELYKATFERFGFRVLTAPSGEVGVQLAALNRVDAVVTDYEMPGMNGEGVAVAIKNMCPSTPVIIFSGSTLLPLRLRRVVDAVCDKAGSRDRLLNVLHRLLHKKGLRTLQPPPVAQASHHGHRTVA